MFEALLQQKLHFVGVVHTLEGSPIGMLGTNRSATPAIPSMESSAQTVMQNPAYVFSR